MLKNLDQHHVLFICRLSTIDVRRRQTDLGRLEVSSPPVGVYPVLPDVGTLPRAVGEAGLHDLPLPGRQRLIDACGEITCT